MNLELKQTAFSLGATLLICGCTTPPPVPPPVVEIPQTRFEEFETAAADRLNEGMLAVVGSAESKSAELAAKRALTDGRKRLARMLDGKIDLLRRSAAEETGTPLGDPVFEPLTAIAQAILRDQVQSIKPVRTEEETISDTVRVYCLMELNPQIIIDQLAAEPKLYEMLKPTQAFSLLFRNVDTTDAVTKD